MAKGDDSESYLRLAHEQLRHVQAELAWIKDELTELRKQVRFYGNNEKRN
jgi:hypothetical protein